MDDLVNLSTHFSDLNLKLENLVTQNQTGFTETGNQLKNAIQDIAHFQNEVDKTIQQIDIEIERNQNILAKLVSGANTKLMQEQINQKRIALVNQVQNIQDGLAQISQETDKFINDFSSSFQQITTDFKNLENQLKTISSTNHNHNIKYAINDTSVGLQQILQQSIDALNSVRQGLEQQKIFNEMNKSINSLLQ